MRVLPVLAVGLVLGTVTAGAADKYPTYIDPSVAGRDYVVQGEYVGKVGGKIPIGVQVIALGGGKYEGIVHGGGLPGAGWDGITRYYIRGEWKRGRGEAPRFVGVHGERLKFENHNFRGTVVVLPAGDGGPGAKVLPLALFQGTAAMFLNQVDDPRFSLERVVRKSLTLGASSPKDARVLFDGSNVEEWVDGKIVEGPQMLLAAGTRSRRKFKDYRLHLEFRTPFMPTARGMQRGNSGVYLQDTWEIQVVDSFGWTTENRKYERLSHVGRCGGLHEMITPRVNMCLPPLSWQTYDIEHTAARVAAAGERARPAVLSVRHNGVLIHDRVILPPVPPGANPAAGGNHLPGPVYLQQHGNPVVYRNIWIVER